MKYNGLTELGRKYLAKIQANREPVKFVKIKFGNGTLQEHENPADFTDVKNIKVEKSILELKQSDDAVKLTAQIDNVGLDEGYYPRETGIYVLDDDREILYYYINDGTEVSYLPPEASGPARFDISINLIATSDTAITVRNDGKDLYITKEYLEKELAKKEDTIEKKSGFNLEKTDSYEEDNNNKLGTAKALYKLYNWVKDTFTVPWSRITEKPNLTSTEDLNRLLSHKEDTFVKNTGFNKNFGTTSGTVMEGDKYEVIKSIPGTTTNIKFIQDSVVKNKGDFCIDKHTGRICKCIQQTSTTTNDSNYFQDVTLDKLSDRLDNLSSYSSFGINVGRLSVSLFKIGKLVLVEICHQGGVEDYSNNDTIPVSFQPQRDIYANIASITGSAFLFIGKSRRLEVRLNGATIQPLASSTAYYSHSAYFTD